VTQSQTADFFSSLKTGTIKTLRSTIQILEKTVNTLENSSNQTNPTIAKILNLLSALWEKVLPIWNQLLKGVRGRLSPDLNQKLSDRVLSGLLAGTIVILFWFTSSLFSAKPPQPRVANRPPLILPTEPKSSFPSDLSTPEAAPEMVAAPAESQQPETVSEPEVIAEPEVSEPEVITEPEVKLAEPILETPVEVESGEVAPEPEAPPLPELTPEETRIAAIEAQVMEISDRFISGLVVSVKQNELRGQMQVNVSNDWYRFNAEQQDRFANELWTRSQTLNLPKLEIRDPREVLLARPPIVGNSMIVVKRKGAIA
jgi:hypothetical protein